MRCERASTAAWSRLDSASALGATTARPSASSATEERATTGMDDCGRVRGCGGVAPPCKYRQVSSHARHGGRDGWRARYVNECGTGPEGRSERGRRCPSNAHRIGRIPPECDPDMDPIVPPILI